MRITSKIIEKKFETFASFYETPCKLLWYNSTVQLCKRCNMNGVQPLTEPLTMREMAHVLDVLVNAKVYNI